MVLLLLSLLFATHQFSLSTKFKARFQKTYDLTKILSKPILTYQDSTV